MRNLLRRLLAAAARPGLAPLHERLDHVEHDLAVLTQSLGELRDRVEADLASLVELTLELRRLAEGLESATDPLNTTAAADAAP